MDYQSFTRIDIAYDKVFGCSPDIAKEEDMLTICALHYILSNNDIYLCINDYAKPKYNFKPNKHGFLFSQELANDILFEDMQEAYYSFSDQEMGVLEMLNAAISKSSVPEIGQTCQYVAKSLARYIYAKKEQHISDDKQILTVFASTNNTRLNFKTAKKSYSEFNNLLEQLEEEHLLRLNQEEPAM